MAPTVGQSLLDTQRREKDEADTLTAMASLTVDNDQQKTSTETSRYCNSTTCCPLLCRLFNTSFNPSLTVNQSFLPQISRGADGGGARVVEERVKCITAPTFLSTRAWHWSPWRHASCSSSQLFDWFPRSFTHFQVLDWHVHSPPTFLRLKHSKLLPKGDNKAWWVITGPLQWGLRSWTNGVLFWERPLISFSHCIRLRTSRRKCKKNQKKRRKVKTTRQHRDVVAQRAAKSFVFCTKYNVQSSKKKSQQAAKILQHKTHIHTHSQATRFPKEEPAVSKHLLQTSILVYTVPCRFFGILVHLYNSLLWKAHKHTRTISI